jgi:hypothetical protein
MATAARTRLPNCTHNHSRHRPLDGQTVRASGAFLHDFTDMLASCGQDAVEHTIARSALSIVARPIGWKCTTKNVASIPQPWAPAARP